MSTTTNNPTTDQKKGDEQKRAVQQLSEIPGGTQYIYINIFELKLKFRI